VKARRVPPRRERRGCDNALPRTRTRRSARAAGGVSSGHARRINEPRADRHDHRDDGPDGSVLIVEGIASDRRLREHQTEEEQDHDGTDVDQDLHPSHELSPAATGT